MRAHPKGSIAPDDGCIVSCAMATAMPKSGGGGHIIVISGLYTTMGTSPLSAVELYMH